jgi:hypothetical protein
MVLRDSEVNAIGYDEGDWRFLVIFPISIPTANSARLRHAF